MKPIPFKMKGTEYALTVKIATYPEGNLAIKLYQESFGQLVFWDSLTVNLGGLRAKDCGFINTKTTGKRYSIVFIPKVSAHKFSQYFSCTVTGISSN